MTPAEPSVTVLSGKNPPSVPAMPTSQLTGWRRSLSAAATRRYLVTSTSFARYKMTVERIEPSACVMFESSHLEVSVSVRRLPAPCSSMLTPPGLAA